MNEMKGAVRIEQDEVIQSFLELISPVKGSIEEMYLFGSRARDDWRPDSDYDILIVLHRKDRSVIDRLYDAVMDVLLKTGKLVSLKIFDRTEFNRLKSIPTPFMENVTQRDMIKGRSVADRIIDRFSLMDLYDAKYREDARKKLLEDTMTATANKKSGIITIDVEDKDPKRAADMANAFVEELKSLTRRVCPVVMMGLEYKF